MSDCESPARARLKTPRAAAVAGILFCVLVTVAYVLLRSALPADPGEPGAWLQTNVQTVALGLNLIPFAGVAFLWFVGVLRDRIGVREDRFFATVVLGSGLLFLAMLFSAAGVIGAIITAFAAAPYEHINSGAFHVARSIAYNLVNIYMIKIGAVFVISFSTITIFTGIFAGWVAYIGYGVALLLLFGSSYFDWVFLAFPLWILLISIYILKDNFRGAASD
jgi:hypothetical protein